MMDLDLLIKKQQERLEKRGEVKEEPLVAPPPPPKPAAPALSMITLSEQIADLLSQGAGIIELSPRAGLAAAVALKIVGEMQKDGTLCPVCLGRAEDQMGCENTSFHQGEERI